MTDLPLISTTAVNKTSLKFSLMITSVALAAVLAGVWLAEIYREHDARAVLLPNQVITLLPEARPLTAFALTDHKNRVFDLASLKGKWSFIFFGFTHCPDVCPTTLAELARARGHIARNTAGAEDIQFVFISVDPNRDTAGKLRQYVSYFEPTFLGVTGDDAQIANLAGQLGAPYQVAITPGMDNYPVTHSTAVFLLDPRARYHAVFTPPHDADAIGKRFKVVRELEAGDAVSAGDAWIREAPPGMSMMAGYMALRNDTSRPQVLVAASSSGFQSVMIHRTIVKDGVAGMAHASQIELKPNASLIFAPGGYHLMLMGPKRTLRAGDPVVINLEFRGGLVLAVAFKVRK
jgi:protein SCO1/2